MASDDLIEDDGLGELTSADEVAAKAEELFGAPLAATGVVHVTAVWRQRADRYVTLDVGSPLAPRCGHDFFVLNLTRARADAIVTTGEILRAEPRLEHRLQGPGRTAEALAAWRRERLGKRGAPVSLILTSGRAIDLEHPLLRSATRPVIYTGRDGQWRLESLAADHGVEVVGVDRPSPRGAVELLRREFGAATIAIEMGPSTSRALYEPPVLVDELLLTVCESPEVAAAARGRRFLSPAEIGRAFCRASPLKRVQTRDGAWSFQRFVR